MPTGPSLSWRAGGTTVAATKRVGDGGEFRLNNGLRGRRRLRRRQRGHCVVPSSTVRLGIFMSGMAGVRTTRHDHGIATLTVMLGALATPL
jgi:hypothetical protein